MGHSRSCGPPATRLSWLCQCVGHTPVVVVPVCGPPKDVTKTGNAAFSFTHTSRKERAMYGAPACRGYASVWATRPRSQYYVQMSASWLCQYVGHPPAYL